MYPSCFTWHHHESTAQLHVSIVFHGGATMNPPRSCMSPSVGTPWTCLLNHIKTPEILLIHEVFKVDLPPLPTHFVITFLNTLTFLSTESVRTSALGTIFWVGISTMFALQIFRADSWKHWKITKDEGSGVPPAPYFNSRYRLWKNYRFVIKIDYWSNWEIGG